MSSDPVIRVDGVGKCFNIYESPGDRLRQFLVPPVQRLMRRPVTHFFREFWALRDLKFEVRRGQTMGIVGRNGSGKSTLLQILCGTLAATQGEVQRHGRVAALLELGSGFNPEFTGRENVHMNATVLGLDPRQIAARFDRIVAFADIGDFLDQPVKTYSSGMMVRLAFAVMAHVDAEILVIDEALAVGDVFFQQKCMRFLREFQAEGGTLLFVSHDTAAVTNLCDSAIWLRNAAAGDVLQGPAADITRAYLQAFYEEQRNSRGAAIAQGPAVPASASWDHEHSHGELPDNLIQVSAFRPDAEAFGERGASFVDAYFVAADGVRARELEGGEVVVLRLVLRVDRRIVHPAFGINFKDRLGQFFIGEGTDLAFRSDQLVFEPGELVTAEFRFRMPILHHGHYAVDIAFAEGCGHDHVQHHWIHEALTLTSLRSRLVMGLVGLQDLSMRIMRESGVSS